MLPWTVCLGSSQFHESKLKFCPINLNFTTILTNYVIAIPCALAMTKDEFEANFDGHNAAIKWRQGLIDGGAEDDEAVLDVYPCYNLTTLDVDEVSCKV